MSGSRNPEALSPALDDDARSLRPGTDHTACAPGDLVLVLGGVRSGKSAHAERLALSCGGDEVLYVATAVAPPDDMALRERIRRHRSRRPPAWTTLECPLRLGPRVEAVIRRADPPRVVLLDCVTLWISNILFALEKEADHAGRADWTPDAAAFEQAAEREIDDLIAVIRRSPCRWIVVSSETGLGIIAPTSLGRIYCDVLGLANQRLAAAAGDVRLVVAGRALSLPAR